MKREDPRIIRTREIIHASFMALLEEKNYDEITVQYILDKANINRSTFYKHYLNKDALASHIIGQFKQAVLLPLLEKRFNSPTLEFATTAVTTMNEHRKTIQLLWKIETRRINFKRDMLTMLKQKYIDVMQKKALSAQSDLNFQGQLFATISVTMLDYLVVQKDNNIDHLTTRLNLQEVLAYFEYK